LLIRSFARLRVVSPGFDPTQLLMVPLDPPERVYDSPEKLMAVYERTRDALRAIPGVQSVALINHLPMTGTGVTTSIELPGRPAAKPGEGPNAIYRLADAEYFGTIGQRVLRGRGFTAADMTPTSTSIVVGDSLARRLWPGKDPIGMPITTFRQLSGRPNFHQPVYGHVIGVVADVKFQALDELRALETVYLPFTVEPWRRAFVAVRAVGNPATLTSAARRAVTSVNPDLPVGEIGTVSSLIDRRLNDRRFTMTVLSTFAASALLLAVIGVYGIVAYAVSQRTREIGIRAALGAQRGSLVSLFVREGVRLAAMGLGVGLAMAVAGTRLLQSMVYGVGVRDTATFAGVGAMLVAVAAAASFIPARRAARVDPVVALRRD
jgi:putative ABC transport system permease protein